MSKYTGLEIAVIGLAGRFPGAANVKSFWDNLKNGVESVRFFTDEELIQAGTDPRVLSNPLYVKANSYLENKEHFDSAFFNYRPDEAALMDPQMRIFHECVWEAIEDAGCNLQDPKNKVGLFAGSSGNVNWEVYAQLANQQGLVDNFSAFQLHNTRFMSTRISYLLNLRGPSVYLDTACSTSLVAVHHACKSLLLNECNVALAGGVTIREKSKAGYVYQEGMIASRDGHCRTFDAQASGTIEGEGAGVVVLKTLKNALAEGDNILALIKGTGLNNDGNLKVGYTAPSVDGQAEAILTAHKWAKVEAESISYVEAHGTATHLGDPIEVEALTRAFGKSNRPYCALGSVKSNIGHLDAAAGVAGLIKTVLALKHRQLPPSLHYQSPNPRINFEQSPFFVNTRLREWTHGQYPLRAGVSSFGVGGTNCHLVLEEAPARQAPAAPGRSCQLVVLSAKTPQALARNAAQLAHYLQENPDLQAAQLADAAFTLQTGRAAFAYRRAVAGASSQQLVAQLGEGKGPSGPVAQQGKPAVVFMFPGQGAQYAGMGYGLYCGEALFRQVVDECLGHVLRLSGRDLKPILFAQPAPEPLAPAQAQALDQTEYTQPALFIFEYALSQLLLSWGIKPDCLIGHSIGEYVAACLSGVFSLEDALRLVLKRGQLMQKAPKGVMLAVGLGQDQLREYLSSHQQLWLAAVNSTHACVVSGTEAAVAALEAQLKQQGHPSRRLRTSHAFHCPLMEEAAGELERAVAGVTAGEARIPLLSNVSGKVASPEQLRRPGYWSEQLRQAVLFEPGISALLSGQALPGRESVVFLEVGPGQSLGTMVQGHALRGKTHAVVSLVRQRHQQADDVASLLAGVGRLWEQGVEVDWPALQGQDKRGKVSLPTYAFEKTPYPVHVSAQRMIEGMLSANGPVKRPQVSGWFYAPTWKLARPVNGPVAEEKEACTLIFADDCGLGEALGRKYAAKGAKVACVKAADRFAAGLGGHYTVNPADEKGYEAVFADLARQGLRPGRLVHAWGVGSQAGTEFSENACQTYCYSLLGIVKAWSRRAGIAGKQLVLLTSDLHPVLEAGGGPAVKALAGSLLKVLSQEHPGLCTSHLDISAPAALNDTLLESLFRDVTAREPGKVISWRNGCRWEQVYDKVNAEHEAGPVSGLRQEGVYLITGGLGNLSFHLARYLLKHYRASVVLLGRTRLPQSGESNPPAEEALKENELRTERVERLRALQAEGKVLYLACDLASATQLAGAVRTAEATFGPLNGVIHAAGIVQGRSLNLAGELEKADFESQFAPKIAGLQALREVMGPKAIDFCLLASSLSAVLGGLQFAAYAPANAFMDYYVRWQRGQGALGNWVSVNFDGLSFEGAPGNAISGQELVEVFERALSLVHLPQLVVSTTDLEERLEKWIRRRSEAQEDTTPAAGEAAGAEAPGVLLVTSTEQALIATWEQFFGKTGITPDDDFFEIGGDSLKALSMIERLRRAHGIDLSITDFYSWSSVRKLGEYLTAKKKAEDVEEKLLAYAAGPNPEPGAAEIRYSPAGAVQKRLFFLHQLEAVSPAAHLTRAYVLRGAVETATLEEAIARAAAAHESLRTSLKVMGDELVQEIAGRVTPRIEHLPPAGTVAETVKRFIRPFQAEEGPLWRAGLIPVSAAERVLVVDAHRMVADAASLDILVENAMACCNTGTLPGGQAQYPDYLAWLRSDLGQPERAGQKNFWLGEFAEEPVRLQLPADYPRPAVKDYKSDTLGFEIDPAQAGQLRQLAEAEGVTLAAVMLAVYAVFLAKLSGQDDITIGVPAPNRAGAWSRVVGPLENTLAVRTRPAARLGLRAYLAGVQEKLGACLANQAYPYEELLEELPPDFDLSRNPLFDVMLSYQAGNAAAPGGAGLRAEPLPAAGGTGGVDLHLAVSEAGEAIHLTLIYATALFSKETIRRYSLYFKLTVAGLLSGAAQRIADIDPLPEDRTPLPPAPLAADPRAGETEKIAALLRQLDKIEAAVVMTHTYKNKGTYLIAFIVTAGLVSTQKVKKYLEAQLPPALVPAYIIKIKEVPVTPDGQADKKALAQMAYTGEIMEDLYLEPRTEAERQVALIWREITGAGRVSRNDTFFDIGGKPLQLLTTSQLMKGKFETDVPMPFYFSHTLEQLCRMIETPRHESLRAGNGQVHT